MPNYCQTDVSDRAFTLYSEIKRIKIILTFDFYGTVWDRELFDSVPADFAPFAAFEKND